MGKKCASNQQGVAGCTSIILFSNWTESVSGWLTYFSGIKLLTRPFAESMVHIRQKKSVFIVGIPSYWKARRQIWKDLGPLWKNGSSYKTVCWMALWEPLSRKILNIWKVKPIIFTFVFFLFTIHWAVTEKLYRQYTAGANRIGKLDWQHGWQRGLHNQQRWAVA